MIRRSPRSADLGLVKTLLGRLMTRNVADRVEAIGMRRNMEMNLVTLGQIPDQHLAMTLQIMHKVQEAGHPPAFETGLMMGACLTLSAATHEGRGMLRRMLRDIEEQQDGAATTPETDELDDGDAPVSAEGPVLQ